MNLVVYLAGLPVIWLAVIIVVDSIASIFEKLPLEPEQAPKASTRFGRRFV